MGKKIAVYFLGALAASALLLIPNGFFVLFPLAIVILVSGFFKLRAERQQRAEDQTQASSPARALTRFEAIAVTNAYRAAVKVEGELFPAALRLVFGGGVLLLACISLTFSIIHSLEEPPLTRPAVVPFTALTPLPELQEKAREAARLEAEQRLASGAGAPADDTSSEPRFTTCEELFAAGYRGSYSIGEDLEYPWYEDTDQDGISCE